MSADADVGTYDNGVWIIGDLSAGESVVTVINTIVTTTEHVNLTNIVIANTGSNETDLTNNEANATVEIEPVVDVAVDVKVNQTTVQKNDTLSWNITATNNGPSLAENVNVTNLLTEGVEFVDVIVPEGTSYDNETHVWNKVNCLMMKLYL